MDRLIRSVEELNKDLHLLEASLASLRTEVTILHEAIGDLRHTNKVLLEFMYKTLGSKAQLIAVMSFVIGVATVSNVLFTIYFH